MEKTINFKVDGIIYRDVKVKIAQEGIKLKEYVIGLINADLKNNAK